MRGDRGGAERGPGAEGRLKGSGGSSLHARSAPGALRAPRGGPAAVPALRPARRWLLAAGAGGEVFPREGMEKLIAAVGVGDVL